MTASKAQFPFAARRGAVALSLSSALLLAACASTQPNPVVEQARSRVDQVAAQPDTVSRAAIELKTAKDSLARADQSWADGDKEEAEHQAYLATQQASTAEALGKARANDAKLQETRGRADQLRLQARTRDLDAARADASTERARADQLQSQIKALEARPTGRGLVVTLGDVLFATGSSQLRSRSDARIDKLVEFLEENPDRKLRIEGYTDSRGSDAANLRLSERRAESVQRALIRRGISADRITVTGYGEEHPVASNDTTDGRALNRRVEVIIADENGVLRSR